jgi:excisionase family DNA binding protein
MTEQPITVPEAARRLRRNPETIRRWIREGKLASERVGTQYLVRGEEIERLLAPESLPLPALWRRTASGALMPDVAAAVRRSRRGH